jgi:hypothetical protein
VEAADLFTELTTSLADDDAWSSRETTSPGVILSGEPTQANELVAMPDGVVSVSQRAVPLGLALDKAGDAPLGDQDTFFVEPDGASMTSTGIVQDWFAPGYFFELAPGEQLSSPSFELLQSGIEFGGGELQSGPARKGTLDFEQILRDPELDEDRVELKTISLFTDPRALLRAEIPSARSASGLAVASDDAIRLAPEAWSVTHRNTGAVLDTAPTWSAAHQSSAGRRAATAVVPSWEPVG